MKVPLSWIKDFIDLNLTPDQIAHKLTMAGLEVDSFTTTGEGFSGVVVGEVLESEKHPDADKLSVAKVTDGKETLQIVCGASNCRKGIKVALAKIGAKLQDENGKSFEIKKGKLRGVESFGMLCSGDELGLTGSDGILELPADAPLGASVSTLISDTIFEISLTPNLGHCTSVFGVARELSAMMGIPLRIPSISIKESGGAVEDRLQVSILDGEACPRYTCRVIQEIQVGPSPQWLKQRLEQSGLRSINNIVDVTNYVLLELGHPLHAFDYDRLDGHKIIVREANPGEKIQTLDGKERVLDRKELVIADASKAIAIAGVMGGSNSEVHEQTKTIVLESAYFSPESIRRTSKRLGLQTDASKRFERGTDPNQLTAALDRAALLIQEVAGGHVLEGIIDVELKEFPELIIPCRLEKVNQVLGTVLGRGEVESIFGRLGFTYRWDGHGQFFVTIPTYRCDIKGEIDLIEEVARLYGYENIGKGKAAYHSSQIPSDPVYLFEREVKKRLIAEGLQEFLTCDLIGPGIMAIIGEGSLPSETLVKVLNPTSVEQSILRQSLLPGLLQVVKHNIDHQNHQIAGYEAGKIHYKDGEGYNEPSVVGIVLSGKSRASHWDAKPQDFDFYDLKGIIENLLRELGVRKPLFKNLGIDTFHTGRQASVYVDSLEIGSFGEIHPAIQRRLDVSQRILFAEFNLHDLMQVAKCVDHIRPLPIYPGSERDWTVTIPETIPFTAVLEAIYNQASPILEEVVLLDIYRSEKLGAGNRNMTFRFKYRDTSKTIEQETVESVHHRLIGEVSKKLHL